MLPARDLQPRPRFASFADIASTPGGCDARTAFQTPPYRPCRPRSPAPDPNLAQVRISLWPPEHRSQLGRLHYLSCSYTQQTWGHAGNPKTCLFYEFATQKLRVFRRNRVSGTETVYWRETNEKSLNKKQRT